MPPGLVAPAGSGRRAREKVRARRQGGVAARGAFDGADGADDDAGLAVEALDEVIAAQGDNVDAVAGERGGLVLHRRPKR